MSMDKIDLFIIDTLTKDARESFRKIAKDLGISPDTVMNRYKKLTRDGVIKGSTVVIDPRKIGYHGMAAFLIDTYPSHVLATEATTDTTLILDELIKMPNIIVATKTMGDHDLLAIGVVVDFEHLIQIGSHIAQIPGVRDLQVSMWVQDMEICPKYFIL
jgi:DNA-binding Lrp family transcriptional regulator